MCIRALNNGSVFRPLPIETWQVATLGHKRSSFLSISNEATNFASSLGSATLKIKDREVGKFRSISEVKKTVAFMKCKSDDVHIGTAVAP